MIEAHARSILLLPAVLQMKFIWFSAVFGGAMVWQSLSGDELTHGKILPKAGALRDATGCITDSTNWPAIHKIHLPALPGINAGKCFYPPFKILTGGSSFAN
jgi:hypothetical protein